MALRCRWKKMCIGVWILINGSTTSFPHQKNMIIFIIMSWFWACQGQKRLVGQATNTSFWGFVRPKIILKLNFVRSHFGKMQLWQVEPFFFTKRYLMYSTVLQVGFVKKKVFNLSELHFFEVTFYIIHTYFKYLCIHIEGSGTSWKRF